MKQRKTTNPEELSEVEISSPPDKEFKVVIIKMLSKLRRRRDEQSEKFNRVRKYKQKLKS